MKEWLGKIDIKDTPTIIIAVAGITTITKNVLDIKDRSEKKKKEKRKRKTKTETEKKKRK
ncbi:hypothetical protein [Bacillus sp. mrc49]|uniref:hypothetical protein n=1 Tax=Bacillus sp. mrc49 TaxID=2054913 RepID=UPI000C276E6B|nr:hypothetical protein [Bacillus sp. mrc49]PJN91560.1 hypothetical protein CVN76_04335 [Bacillus sp. mrc49]